MLLTQSLCLAVMNRLAFDPSYFIIPTLLCVSFVTVFSKKHCFAGIEDVNIKISVSIMKIIMVAAVVCILAGCVNMLHERFILVDDGEIPLARFILEEHGETIK